MPHGGGGSAGPGQGGAMGPGQGPGLGGTGMGGRATGSGGKKGKKDKDEGFSPSEALTTGFSVAGLPGAVVGLGISMATEGEGPSTKGPTMSGPGATPSAPAGPRGNATLGSEDLPSVPSAENSGDALSAAEDAQRERDARRRGRASTILTGGQGLATAAPVARRTLMGS